jgi:histidinol-phosphate aminotransferase
MADHNAPMAHGGLLAEEMGALGVYAADVLDVSVNVNPYGPCPSVRRAIADAPIERYPDPTAAPAKRALADHVGVDSGRVIVGNGAVDLLWILARATLRPGERAMVVEPAFSEMRLAAVRAGASIVEYRTRPENHFAVDLGALEVAIRETRPRLVYLCTPSNPAGVGVSLRDVSDLAERNPQVLFVVDISFLSLSERHAEADVAPPESIVSVRSLTKDFALAGLRVGYAVAATALVDLLESHRPPWSVNALAQAAAVATTTADASRFVAESRERWLADRAALTSALGDLRLRVHPSETVYLLADLGDRRRATELRDRLLQRQRVLVRDATSFGLRHHIRIGARAQRDLERLVGALQKELQP